jgi:hypothetical protein
MLLSLQCSMCNIYLKASCFLFWLYIDMSCIMPQHSALLSLLSLSQVDVHMQLLKAVLCMLTGITFLAEIECAPCFQQSHTTVVPLPQLFCFKGQCVEGCSSNQLSWVINGLWLLQEMHLAVTYDHIVKENLPAILFVILPPHDLWIRITLRMLMSVMSI